MLESADRVSLSARVEEERAVGEEIRRRMVAAGQAMERGKLLMSSAFERSARVKAMAAFFEGQGTRAHFDRMWPQIFASAREAAGSSDG